ncbi:MAG: 4-hydroxybutyrate dehydrogenase [Peptostreptococcaceae bacterium]|nr:4-hydroxybutyrate dehydrogenase [Peptostreptococcaceae bacterium]
MQLFKLKTVLHKFNTFKEFAEEFKVNEKDLLITNEFIYDPFMKALDLKAHVIFQEKYGLGEPSDEMMNAILKDAKAVDFDRIIAVGGGTVVDISKLFVLKGVDDVVDAFEKKIDLIKEKELIIIPTTCGTGSEVTNISIAEIKSKQTKMGLAVDEILADTAVLIPEMIGTLPYKFYVYSSIDALIHAVESYVSPKANPYTKLFAKDAMRLIIDIYKNIVEKGPEYRLERLDDVLMASNYAGIAFGNAGVGAVHAMSYPLGGTYHVAHGEANYQFFTEVFKFYYKKDPNGGIEELNAYLAELLDCKNTEVYEKLEELLDKLLSRNPLHTYGMKEEEIEGFADAVIKNQQRLLANNYVELTRDEIRDIYKKLF